MRDTPNWRSGAFSTNFTNVPPIPRRISKSGSSVSMNWSIAGRHSISWKGSSVRENSLPRDAQRPGQSPDNGDRPNSLRSWPKGVSGNPKGRKPGTPQRPIVPSCFRVARTWRLKDWDAFFDAVLAKNGGDVFSALHDVLDLWSVTRRSKSGRGCLQCLLHLINQPPKRRRRA